MLHLSFTAAAVAPIAANFCLTVASILYGTFGNNRSISGDIFKLSKIDSHKQQSSEDHDTLAAPKQRNLISSLNFSDLDTLIKDMYRGNGINVNKTLSSSSISLSKDVTLFEDPAAKCCGSKEVIEAFRVLRLLQPESLTPPCRISAIKDSTTTATTTTTDHSIVDKNVVNNVVVTYYLNQRYGNGMIDLKSLLFVTVNNVKENTNYINNNNNNNNNNKSSISNIKHISNHQQQPYSFEITKIEEQWNGVQLLDGYIFKLSRRFNGFISWIITSNLVSQR